MHRRELPAVRVSAMPELPHHMAKIGFHTHRACGNVGSLIGYRDRETVDERAKSGTRAKYCSLDHRLRQE